MIGDKRDDNDPELIKQRQLVAIFDLYDQIVRNALGMQTLLKNAEATIDPDKSAKFSEVLLSLHSDAADYATRISNLVVQNGIDRRLYVGERRKRADRRLKPIKL